MLQVVIFCARIKISWRPAGYPLYSSPDAHIQTHLLSGCGVPLLSLAVCLMKFIGIELLCNMFVSNNIVTYIYVTIFTPMSSPFNFGTLAGEEHFCNRTSEVQKLSSNFLLGINTTLISARRWGKSSLVDITAKRTQKRISAFDFAISICSTPETSRSSMG